MRILAIETTGRVGSAALLEADDSGSRVVDERFTPAGVRTAQSLLPTVQELLRDRGWRPTDVDLLCVAIGPGSFTGLRIGVVAAKTFAYATGAQLVGVHTLTAIAAGVAPRETARLSVVLDAQRQELFVADFTARSPLEQAWPETRVLPIADWLAELRTGDSVAGPPLATLRDRVAEGVIVTDEATWHPRAAMVGAVGVELARRGEAVDPLTLTPHYHRRSAAEEKAARSEGR